MKKLAFQLFSLLMLVCLFPSFASTKDAKKACGCFIPCEKTYISPEQLGMTPQGIFVKFNDEWFQTELIRSDEHGLFIQNVGRSICPDKDDIECRSCHRCVHKSYNICPYCDKYT